jgi:hypothetical protein
MFRFHSEPEISSVPTTVEVARSLRRMRECLLFDEGISQEEKALASNFLYEFSQATVHDKKQIAAAFYVKISDIHGRSDVNFFTEASEIILAIDRVYGETTHAEEERFTGTAANFFQIELSKKLVQLTNINFPVYTEKL